MTGENNGKPSGRESQEGDEQPGSKTPNIDMQPEDAGTAESGNDARATATDGAMKQTSKTDAQSGSKQ